MYKYFYMPIFILFFILLTGNVYANSITAATIFEIENTKPAIESIEKVNNSLIIKIIDQNGYKDILDDGYVNILSKSNIANASFKSGSGATAIYEYKIKDEIDIIMIEVSDGKEVVTKNYTLSKSTPKITGYSIINNESSRDNILKRIIARILSWFK